MNIKTNVKLTSLQKDKAEELVKSTLPHVVSVEWGDDDIMDLFSNVFDRVYRKHWTVAMKLVSRQLHRRLFAIFNTTMEDFDKWMDAAEVSHYHFIDFLYSELKELQVWER